MTPDQITQLRQVLKKAKAIRKNGMTFNDTYTVQDGLAKICDCVDQALALLPCETCNGTGKKLILGCWGMVHKEIPCPDCQ